VSQSRGYRRWPPPRKGRTIETDRTGPRFPPRRSFTWRPWGALARSLEKETGSLEAGKNADLILVDAELTTALPLFDPYTQLVYSLKGGTVRNSIITGRFVMRDRRVFNLNEAAVRNKAKEYQKRIAASLGR
jgi:urease alpha subunit